MDEAKQLNPRITIGLISVIVVGTIGTLLLVVFSSVPKATWFLAIVLYLITGLSITAGYHRLFAHKSYKTAWHIRLLFALFGAGAFQGSIFEWTSDHRNHHKHTDTLDDPYNINLGFWHAHMLWMFYLNGNERDFSNIKDLKACPIALWQHRYFRQIATFMAFILPVLIASIWGDPLGGFIVAGTLRLAALHQSTFLINSLCHLCGDKTYSETGSARDNWLTSLLTFGEGFHNYHHRFSSDYRNGIRIYHFDPTKWLINLLALFGWAYDLKRTDKYKILSARLKREQLRVNPVQASVQSMYEKLQNLIANIAELERTGIEYIKVKNQSAAQSRASYKALLCKHRIRIKNANTQLQRMLREWTELLTHVQMNH